MLSRLFGGGGGGGGAIDVAEAERRAAAGEIILVDVREKNEWASGHAAKARHIPLGSLHAHLPKLAKQGKPVAFVCRSGGRSSNACGQARGAGIEAINVKGGMIAWQRAGLMIVR
jgi:rhodanese-related sulfurtransferase